MRVTPRLWIGLAIWAGYVVVVTGVQIAGGVPYTEWGDSGANLFRGAGISLIVATVLLIITTSALGWWRPALRDRERARHRWPIVAPALMAIAVVLNLAATDWSAYDGAFLAASLVLILVGFTEELTARGLLLVALRSRLTEVWVWLITTALFALMHGVNIVLGQAVAPTLQQIGFAFLGGTVLYILRRTTASLIPAMILHGLFDFSTFATGVGTPGPLAVLGGTVNLLAGIVALAAVAFVIRGANERIDRLSSPS